jgi:hypothetical protein
MADVSRETFQGASLESLQGDRLLECDQEARTVLRHCAFRSRRSALTPRGIPFCGDRLALLPPAGNAQVDRCQQQAEMVGLGAFAGAQVW